MFYSVLLLNLCINDIKSGVILNWFWAFLTLTITSVCCLCMYRDKVVHPVIDLFVNFHLLLGCLLLILDKSTKKVKLSLKILFCRNIHYNFLYQKLIIRLFTVFLPDTDCSGG